MKFRMGTTTAAVIRLAIMAGSAGLAPLASAQPLFTIDVTQAGGNVVANGIGSIDLTGLSFHSRSNLIGSFTEPSLGVLVVGPAETTDTDAYSGITSPGSLGPGVGAAASSGSGDLVGQPGRKGKAGEHADPLIPGTTMGRSIL